MLSFELCEVKSGRCGRQAVCPRAGHRGCIESSPAVQLQAGHMRKLFVASASTAPPQH